MNPPEGVLDNIKKNIGSLIPYQSEKKSMLSEFLSSNTMISRLTFLLAIIIIFSSLFYIGSKILYTLLSPSPTPYIISGMKDATEALTVTQALGIKSSIPLLRSIDQYDGIEFTYSFWIYVNNLEYKDDLDFMHARAAQVCLDLIIAQEYTYIKENEIILIIYWINIQYWVCL